MTIIQSSKAFARKKWSSILLFLPFFLYGVSTSINNLTGVDITGGWMGERESPRADFVILLTIPLYMFWLIQATNEVFFSPAPYIVITKNNLSIRQGRKLNLDLDDIELLKVTGGEPKRTIRLLTTFQKEAVINFGDIDISESEFQKVCSDFSIPLMLE